MKIAVLGAPGTGKSWLVRALTEAKSVDLSKLGQTTIHDGPEIRDGPTFDVVLLMGLDLVQPSSATLQTDQRLRESLAHLGIGFRVVYGQNDARLANAQRALATAERKGATPWRHNCDTCSDPGCDNHHQPNQRAPDTSIFVLIRGAVVGTCRRLVLAVRHTRRPLVLFESSRGPTLPEPG